MLRLGAQGQTYYPYGDVLASYGAAGSDYGYTGEWTDATGLVHLRARYLDTRIGRFLTRDTWNGDYNQPISLNKWMYVEGNPINLVDPSGHFITEDDINDGVAVYSCNCGWLDFHHANPSLSKKIHDTVKTVQNLNPPEGSNFLRYRQNVMVIDVKQSVQRNIPNTSIWVEDLGFKATITKNLSAADQWGVSLGLLKTLSTMREWSSVIGGGDSHFSEEDLTSDMIGFHLARHGYGNPMESEVAWQWLAEKCGFNKNRKDASDQSLEVFKIYGSHETIRTWNSPRLHVNSEVAKYLCDEGICPDLDKRKWPSEFTSISPNYKDWSFYSLVKGDFLKPSGYENIYYSGYSLW